MPAKTSGYRVAPKKSLFASDGNGKRFLLKGNDPIPSGLYDKKTLEGFLKNGYVIAGSMTEGVDTWSLGTVGEDTEASPEREKIKVQRPKGPLVQEKKAPEKPKVTNQESPWMFDPKSLEGKSVESLIGMIADINAEWVSEGMSAEEAIEILSQDFKTE